MKRFLKNIAILILVCILAFSLIAAFNFFVVGGQYRCNYQASLIDKISRLKSLEGPKIILVGNSNLTFGMDSRLLEEAIGMPVVNMGLHAALGNSFHEEIAKINVSDGDVVVVCHTSFSEKDKIYDAPLAWVTVDNNPEIWKLFRAKDYPAMLKAYPEYLRNSFFLWITHAGNIDEGGCYSRSAFNEYGDVVIKPEEKRMDPDKCFKDAAANPVTVPDISDECVEHLNEYNKYITEHGATMLVAGYPIAYGKYTTFEDADFTEFKTKLEEKLDCDVISDYADYFYPYAYFYNTTLHLTAEGAEARTKQLISDLKRWMDSSK